MNGGSFHKPVPPPASPPEAAPAALPPPAPKEWVKGEPLIQLDSRGERLGAVGMLVLMVGALLPWGAETYAAWGPLHLSTLDLVPLALGFLALAQVASTATRMSNVVLLGIANLGSLAALGAKFASGLASHDPVGIGLPVMLLGVALGSAAMELERREAGLNYLQMMSRALDLAMQPRVQVALLKLTIPLALAGGVAFAILEVYGDAVANKLGFIFLAYFFNPLGKEVAIPLALATVPAPALDPVLTWCFIVFIDTCTALFFVWNFDHVLHVPFIGRFFAWVEHRGNLAVVKYKWIGRLAFVGLMTYATLPLEGTGAIGGSVVGRAIGLDAARTFLAVVAGSIIRTSLTTLVVLGALQALGI